MKTITFIWMCLYHVVVNLMLEVIQPHLDAVHKDILKVAGLA